MFLVYDVLLGHWPCSESQWTEGSLRKVAC